MRQLLLIILLALLFTGCSKSVSDAPNPTVPDQGVIPIKGTPAVLVFPEQNAVCTSGTILSDTQSSVTFIWKAATNATGYDLVLKNLQTNTTTTQTTTDIKMTIVLNRNTPYSWYIASKSSTTANSDTWKFYNSGPGVTTYAPFPAELVSPGFNQALGGPSADLKWTGAVTAGSIANYDVYLGPNASPPLYKANVTDSFLNAVPVLAKTTYYWKIATRDVSGNTSYSAISQFTVN